MVLPRLLVLLAGLSLASVAAAEAGAAPAVLPPGVEDPFGLGPRLALIDHLQERHGITMHAGSDWTSVLARYEALVPTRSREEIMAADRRARLLDALGIADDPALSEAELRQRLRVQEASALQAYGVSNPDASGASRRAGDGDGDRPGVEDPAARHLRLVVPPGESQELTAADAASDDGALTWLYETDTYAVAASERELAEQVAAHAHAFQDAVLPVMRLERQPRLRGAPIAIRVYADRAAFLASAAGPPPTSAGVCQIGVDARGRASRIIISCYGDEAGTLAPVLQHELVHALHAAAFGRLTHSWYAEGLATFFQHWQLGESVADNFARRPHLLARLPYIRYQHSLGKLPDLNQFWETTWNEDSPFRYQIAEAFMDYLIQRNEAMLKRCHAKCRAEVSPHRYFTDAEMAAMNADFQAHIAAAMAAAGE